MTREGAEAAVLPLLIHKIFLYAPLVALYVEMLANGFHKTRHHHRLGGAVGVEAISAWLPAQQRVLALAPGIEARIGVAQLAENEERLVAVDEALQVAGLQRIALYHQEGAAVVGGYASGIPSQEVGIGMSAPLSHNLRSTPAAHRQPVEHRHYRPVGGGGAPAYVDHGKVAVGLHPPLLGELAVFPYLETSLLVGAEMHTLKRTRSRRHPAVYLPTHQWLATRLAHFLHLIAVEHGGSRLGKRLHIVRGIFRRHKGMVGIFGTLGYKPVDGLERGAPFPEKPQVGARLAARRLRECRRAPFEKRGGKGGSVAKGERVFVDLIPGHEVGAKLAFARASRLVFAVEEGAGAVGCRLKHYHGKRLQEHAAAGGAHYLLGSLERSAAPEPHFREMHKVVVASSAGVGALGSAELYLEVAPRHAKRAAPYTDILHASPLCRLLPLLCEEPSGIAFQHTVKHILYLVGGYRLVGYDERVETLAVNQLQP